MTPVRIKKLLPKIIVMAHGLAVSLIHQPVNLERSQADAQLAEYIRFLGG